MKYETYTYIKKKQEAFVKRVIEVFQIKPEDLDTTPEYFCGVFGLCKFQTRPLNWKFSWAREAEIVVLGNKINLGNLIEDCKYEFKVPICFYLYLYNYKYKCNFLTKLFNAAIRKSVYI